MIQEDLVAERIAIEEGHADELRSMLEDVSAHFGATRP